VDGGVWIAPFASKHGTGTLSGFSPQGIGTSCPNAEVPTKTNTTIRKYFTFFSFLQMRKAQLCCPTSAYKLGTFAQAAVEILHCA